MNEKASQSVSAVPAALSLADYRPLSVAEEKVVAHLQMGDFDRLGDGLRPRDEDPERTVRAELLRYLILGNDEYRLHEKGLRLTGAWITGILDLEGCRIPRDIGLKDCHFEASPILRSAIIDNLFLDGSALPGLQADRLEARGCLSLRAAIVTGEIRLPGARIGGSIEADGVSIASPDGIALDADGLETSGGILLRGADVRGGLNLSAVRLGGDVNAVGARLERPGEVVLNGDGIVAAGDLALRGAIIVGETRLLGARFGGDIDCTSASLSQPGGYALRLNRTTIDGAFFLRQNASVEGTLDLTATTIGAIDDEMASWPKTGDLLLNRCRYGAFIGGPADAESRLDWLARQTPERWGADFWPQPYEQLSKVLREMGHDEEARAVLITKERLQRKARRARAKNPALRVVLAVMDAILAVTLRYGRQPLLALVWLMLFWAIGAGVFGIAYRSGAMKPNSPVVLRSPEWTMCDLQRTETRFMPSAGQDLRGRAEVGQNQLTCFRNQPEAASYPEFNALMYSLDVLLPVASIGQKEYWRPDSLKPTGTFTLRYYFFQSVIGWALSLLAVAGFSGLVKSQ
ncbi:MULTISPECIES: hypothetical protein [unclassified Rhizobium]|uniref:hypothetical protein n=1 Tax=unclassified Rhizobium TaxID=2613769 RepID=UPI001607524F|nr:MULTISPECIES: hypothetical protein [unclassified Rhizobium]MBB3541402.1 hypothetical protein [Rhizobium sp. BK399]MCS3740126.1 hypothetical protein [Rhizobium sp. BK661]MCS4091924.1 hypothetical protein [Rhizobium sp. BK176]